jgi:hypothetical protein
MLCNLKISGNLIFSTAIDPMYGCSPIEILFWPVLSELFLLNESCSRECSFLDGQAETPKSQFDS